MLKNRLIIGSFLIIALSLACYLNSISNPFLFDDLTLIKENRSIKSLDRIFLPDENRLYFRPITSLTLWADHKLFGDNPAGYRGHNILLHIIASLLVFIFLYRLSGSYYLSLLSGMIFSSHPIHSEVINMIALGRGYLYATIFSLISMICYIQAKRGGSKVSTFLVYMISGIASIFSILSNEIGLLTPIFIIAYEFSYSEGSSIKDIIFNKRCWLILSLALTPLIFFRSFLFKILSWGIDGLDLGLRGVPYLMVRYLSLLALPIRLSAWYQGMEIPSSVFTLEAISSFAIIIGILFFIYRVRGSKELLFPSISLMVGIFVISMRIMGGAPSPMGERWAYLPSVWFSLLIPLLFERARTKKEGKGLGYMRNGILVSLLGLYMVLSAQRNFVWSDSYRFWLDTVSKAPKSAVARNNLGTKYLQENRIKEASNELVLAVSLDPEYAIAHNNLGIAMDRLDKLDEAIEEYKRAIQLYPRYDNAYINMGNTYHKKGELDKAIEAQKEAIRLKPDIYTAHYNLANIYRDKGLFNEAIIEYDEAIRLNPGHADSHNNLGVIYMKKGMIGRAMKEHKKTILLNLNHTPAHKNLALAYMQIKDYNNAILEFNEVLKRAKGDIDSHNLLAVIYLDHLRDIKNGLYHLKESLRLKPDQKEAAQIRERIKRLDQ